MFVSVLNCSTVVNIWWWIQWAQWTLVTWKSIP